MPPPLALSIIAVMALATLIGSLVGHDVPLSVGVLAHEGGTVLVVLNSLRLLGFPGWAPPGSAAPARNPAKSAETGALGVA